MQSRLIGLYDFISHSGFCGFLIMINSAHFHWVGKWFVRSIAIKKFVKYVIALLGRHFMTQESMLSCPGDLFCLRLKISLSTSLGETCLIGKLMWHGTIDFNICFRKQVKVSMCMYIKYWLTNVDLKFFLHKGVSI